MPKPINDRIVELRARKNQLTVRLDTLESRSKKEVRKRDTRRKIIVGGAVLAHMEKDHAFADWLRAFLAHSVGRMNDRRTIADLLPPLSAEASRPPKL